MADGASGYTGAFPILYLRLCRRWSLGLCGPLWGPGYYECGAAWATERRAVRAIELRPVRARELRVMWGPPFSRCCGQNCFRPLSRRAFRDAALSVFSAQLGHFQVDAPVFVALEDRGSLWCWVGTGADGLGDQDVLALEVAHEDFAGADDLRLRHAQVLDEKGTLRFRPCCGKGRTAPWESCAATLWKRTPFPW